LLCVPIWANARTTAQPIDLVSRGSRERRSWIAGLWLGGLSLDNFPTISTRISIWPSFTYIVAYLVQVRRALEPDVWMSRTTSRTASCAC
jgi:hypothetical protein